MAHKLLRLREKVMNKPHLIHPSNLDNIADYLNTRNLEGKLPNVKLAIDENKIALAANRLNISDANIGKISIDGSLTYESSGWEAYCGGTSYKMIQDQFDSMLSRGVKTIVLDVSSGGGEAYFCFELARYMRAEADLRGVKILAYVDGMAASAAYALTSIADEVIMNPQAEAGSIGVVMRLVNNNKAMDKAGLETTYVFAGDSKIPFDEQGEFRADFIADLQSKADEMYDEFSLLVADFRGIPEQAVKETKAGVFTAKKALEIGLADKTMTHQEFYQYLADSTGDSMPLNMNTTKTKEDTKMSADTEVSQDFSLESFNELQAQLTAQVEANAEMSAFLAEAKEEKAKLAKQAHESKLAELSTKFSGYSFAKEDSAALVELADTLDEGKQTLLFSVFDKASNLVTEAVEEELVVEGETEVELSTGDVDAQKKATANAIAAKYTTSA